MIELAVVTRYVGKRFDDDQNLLLLASFASTDVRVSRRVTRQARLFVAAENVFDQGVRGNEHVERLRSNRLAAMVRGRGALSLVTA